MTRLLSAQGLIQAVLRRTNLLMAGKRVAIVGDAPPGLATRLRDMGAHPGSSIEEADLVFGDGLQPRALKPGAVIVGSIRCDILGMTEVRQDVHCINLGADGAEVYLVSVPC
ncbi:hypothetical protein ACFWY5_26035 [Nonomuraea sp. NPDC059007]|uniref:hypothetical protein n=1 Tax=Nonomuraea sp. NPDC059007 TaxID=3346692 RepID=UPI0036B59738